MLDEDGETVLCAHAWPEPGETQAMALLRVQRAVEAATGQRFADTVHRDSFDGGVIWSAQSAH